MELKTIQKKVKKDVVISIRTTQEASNWMKEHKISPTRFFNKALEELQKSLEKKV